MKKSSPKILILRFSSIGDIVLTTPLIRCLKTQIPGCEIHFSTKKQFNVILNTNPYIAKLHLLENDLSNFIATLKIEKFDYIIDLHNNIRTRIIKFKLGVKSFSFEKINFQKFLITQFKINRLPKIHIVDRYLEAVSDLGVKNDGKGLDFFIDANTDSLPVFEEQEYVVYAIGGQHFTKKLPFAKQIELLTQINKKIILIGGKEDEEAGNLLANSVNNIFNLCGKLSIHQSALCIQKSKFVITHDTGMMHIAAALNKTIFSIWGNTIPEFGMTPYFKKNTLSKSIVIENNELSCRPCSKIGYKKCPKAHFKCMNDLSFESLNFPDF